MYEIIIQFELELGFRIRIGGMWSLSNAIEFTQEGNDMMVSNTNRERQVQEELLVRVIIVGRGCFRPGNSLSGALSGGQLAPAL